MEILFGGNGGSGDGWRPNFSVITYDANMMDNDVPSVGLVADVVTMDGTPCDKNVGTTWPLGSFTINTGFCGNWKHVITAGCSSVLTTGTHGSEGDSCWKGYSDSQINAMMVDSMMKIEFSGSARETLYVQLVTWSPSGNLRDWATEPNPNTAKWRWSEGDDWRGPCGHDQQQDSGYWFFFKTSGHSSGCQAGNFENTVSSSGFENRDGADFWPITGWSSNIKLYVSEG